MLTNYKISISTGIALVLLAGAAFLMADGELSAWAYVLSSVACASSLSFIACVTMWSLLHRGEARRIPRICARVGSGLHYGFPTAGSDILGTWYKYSALCR